MKWREDYIQCMKQPIQTAEKQLALATYISDCTGNAEEWEYYQKVNSLDFLQEYQ